MQITRMDRMSFNEAGSSCLPQKCIHRTCMLSLTSCFTTGTKSNLLSVPTGMDLRQGISCLHVLQWHLLYELVQIILSRSLTDNPYRIRRDLSTCEEKGVFAADLGNTSATQGTAAPGPTGKSREGHSKIQSFNPSHLSAQKGHISTLVWPGLETYTLH